MELLRSLLSNGSLLELQLVRQRLFRRALELFRLLLEGGEFGSLGLGGGGFGALARLLGGVLERARLVVVGGGGGGGERGPRLRRGVCEGDGLRLRALRAHARLERLERRRVIRGGLLERGVVLRGELVAEARLEIRQRVSLGLLSLGFDPRHLLGGGSLGSRPRLGDGHVGGVGGVGERALELRGSLGARVVDDGGGFGARGGERGFEFSRRRLSRGGERHLLVVGGGDSRRLERGVRLRLERGGALRAHLALAIEERGGRGGGGVGEFPRPRLGGGVFELDAHLLRRSLGSFELRGERRRLVRRGSLGETRDGLAFGRARGFGELLRSRLQRRRELRRRSLRKLRRLRLEGAALLSLSLILQGLGLFGEGGRLFVVGGGEGGRLVVGGGGEELRLRLLNRGRHLARGGGSHLLARLREGALEGGVLVRLEARERRVRLGAELREARLGGGGGGGDVARRRLVRRLHIRAELLNLAVEFLRLGRRLGGELRLARDGAFLHRGEFRGGGGGSGGGVLARLANLAKLTLLALGPLRLELLLLLLQLHLGEVLPVHLELLLLARDLLPEVFLEHVECLVLVGDHLFAERLEAGFEFLGGSLGGSRRLGVELLDARRRLRGGRLERGEFVAEGRLARRRLGAGGLERFRRRALLRLGGELRGGELSLEGGEFPLELLSLLGGGGGDRLGIADTSALLGEGVLRARRSLLRLLCLREAVLDVSLALRQRRFDLGVLLVADARALLLEAIDAELKLLLLLLDALEVVLQRLVLAMETLLLVLHALELLLGRHLRSSRRRRSRHLRGGVGVRNSRRGCLRLEHRRLHLADHLLFHRLARVHELILLVQHHLQCLLRRLDLLDELLDVHVAVALLRLGAEHHHALHAGDKIALVEHGRGEFHHASRLARRLHRERHAACAEVLWGHALAAETVQPGTQTGAGGG